MLQPQYLFKPAPLTCLAPMQRITSRKVIEDDRRGRQRVQVEHEAEWKFLCFGGTFSTTLEVEQNEREGTVGHRFLHLVWLVSAASLAGQA